MTHTITRNQIKAALENQEPIILVEALPQKYFDDAHLSGALQINNDEVDAKAPGLLPDQTAKIVVYCSSSDCSNSGEAALRLTELGYTNVHKYAEGKQDWMAAGLPVQKSISV